MSISITQTPAQISLAQSPVVFSVLESNTVALTSSSVQYIGELYYWTGSVYNSSSADYTLVKYPNDASTGIFEISNILNSTLSDLLQSNPSNEKNFAVDFYLQFKSSSVFVTGSHTKSSTYKVLDGYGIFPEQIGQSIASKSPYWPLMTDGPATQSVFVNNYGSGSSYRGIVPAMTASTSIFYSSSVGTGSFSLLPSATSTTASVGNFPLFPSTLGFPLTTVGLSNYTIQPYSASVPLGAPIRYEIDCIQKYPNIRIKWKNRYGQFDFFNFYMVNKQSFSTTKKTYQPQLGTFNSSTLTYNSYDSAVLNYIVDSKQAISVNTFWISENYNDILKQLLVSDEIYWVTNEQTDESKPLTIATSNVVFKTGVVDKQIQYQFDFNFGQNYKLIL